MVLEDSRGRRLDSGGLWGDGRALQAFRTGRWAFGVWMEGRRTVALAICGRAPLEEWAMPSFCQRNKQQHEREYM